MTIRQGTTIISGGGGKVTSVNGEIGDVVVKSVVNEKDNSTQLKFWLGTQEEYETITEKDDATIYYTQGEDSSAISYNDLTDKPSINNVPLSGDMTLAELGIQGELQAGTGITIEDNVISATVVGGVTSVNGQTGDVTVEGLKDQNTVNTGLLKFWTGTKEQYAEIETKDPNTLYYVGETLTPATLATVATTGLYTDLLEKPQINNIELTGNKTLTELGIAATSDLSTIATSGSYTDAKDKPQINTVILEGNKTLEDLGIQETLTPGTGIDITNGTISSTVTTPDASTTVKGISRYATDEETIAHTVTTAAITPSNLADLYTTKENTANKVTTISDDATDTQYPSAAAVNSRIMHIMNNSTDFVRTSGNQTIGDTKIFTGSFYKKVDLDVTQNPEENIYTDNKLITNQDDSAMSYTTLSLTTEGSIVNVLYLRRMINEKYRYTGFSNIMDSEGNGFTCAVSAHDKNDPLYKFDSVITAGDLVNDAKDFNIVHKSGNEEIAGTKTFTDNITAPNQIDYTRITNCITKIPQDIKLELNNGTLTLKTGSKVYIPNGSGVFDEVITSTDMTLSYTKPTLTKELLLLRNDQTAIEHWTTTDCYSGNSQPLETYHCWYNTDENTIKSTTDGGSSYSTNLSLPIAIVSVDSTGILSIDQIFNGLGYISSTVFTLPGIEGLAPNGFNEDGSLKNTRMTSSSIAIRTLGSTNFNNKNVVYFNTSNSLGIQLYNRYQLDKNKNLIVEYNSDGTFNRYISGGSAFVCAEVICNENKIISLSSKHSIQVPDIYDVITRDEYLTETEIQRQIFNRIYDGRDLTKVFAKEIQHYSDEWAWIKTRIQKGDYSGLYVGDYIPVTMSAGTVGDQSIAQQTFQCQIAGIDTYTNCGDTIIGHHIDFISREVIDTEITWNPEDNNNGTANEVNPWLSSQIYAWLNGVNNYTTSAYNNVPHGGDYSAGGILQLLPTKLTDKIITKRNLLDSRYDTTELLTYSTTWVWKDMGKLWLPNEIEVYGTQIRSNLGYAQSYWNPEANIAVAYPIYLGSGRNRVKKISTGGRSSWWLSSVVAHYASYCCICNGYGDAGSNVATHAGVRAPLCFRVA